MKRSYSLCKIVILVFITSSVILIQCKDDERSLTITSISPKSGTIGTIVYIFGKGFSETAEENIVKFNGIDAEVSSAGTEALAVTVPDGAITGKVTVQIGSITATGPSFKVTEERTYYIIFKADGVQKIFDEGDPIYETCFNCACNILLYSGLNHAQITICNEEDNLVTAADIKSWNGDKILFNTNIPIAHFHFQEGATFYMSSYADSQEGSEMNITDVIREPSGYRVKGNFKCKVAISNGPDINITEGVFVVRFPDN